MTLDLDVSIWVNDLTAEYQLHTDTAVRIVARERLWQRRKQRSGTAT
jgi:hypothetical protein